jgi:SWIM zinc finger
MKILQEVTDWQDYPVANHVYFTDDSRGKIYAYIKQGTDNVFEFAAPIKFDVRGRKFKTVDVNIWNFIPRGDAQPEDKTWQVQGSKEVYTVTKDYTGKISCSCPGFKYRGDCKHVKLDFIVGQIK